MIGALDDAAEMPVAETERIDVEVYCVLKFIDGKAVSTDRIPQADELEVRNSPLCLDLMPVPLRGGRPSESVKPFSPKSIPSMQNFALKRLLGKLRVDQALIANQADQDADRVGTSAESECKDFFTRAAVSARQEGVEMAHVPCEPDAESAADQCQRAERGRSDAVVIFGELIISAQVKSSIDAPDIVFLRLCAAVSRPLRQ